VKNRFNPPASNRAENTKIRV